jgi:multidrug transporter EmrE-like cation transporter
MSSALAGLLNNPIGLILVAASFGVCGQLSLKMGMVQVGRLGADAFGEPLQLASRILSSPLVLGGLALYVAGAGVWMMVLSRAALSFAYPILAVGYAITPVLAWLLLGESVNAVRWLGIAIICLGVFVVSRS